MGAHSAKYTRADKGSVTTGGRIGGKNVLLSLCCLVFFGCFPNKVAHLVEGDMLQELRMETRTRTGKTCGVFTQRAKVFTHAGDIYLFPKGFYIDENNLAGNGGMSRF